MREGIQIGHCRCKMCLYSVCRGSKHGWIHANRQVADPRHMEVEGLPLRTGHCRSVNCLSFSLTVQRCLPGGPSACCLAPPRIACHLISAHFWNSKFQSMPVTFAKNNNNKTQMLTLQSTSPSTILRTGQRESSIRIVISHGIYSTLQSKVSLSFGSVVSLSTPPRW